MKHSHAHVSSGNPETFITLNKNRQAVVGNKIFLNNGAEFEIELNNVTSNTVLAKIKLNRNYISNSGIVLRPGERVHLERYLENNNRFKFDIYNIPSGNKASIEDNGLIEIEYYRETVVHPHWPTPYWNPTDYTNTSSGNVIRTDGTKQILYDAQVNTLSAQNMVFDSHQPEIETGRIEEGSRSDQEFHNVNKSFETYAFYTETFHIMPVSQRSIKTVRIYCETSTCGRRQRGGDVFCPICGERY